jgi:dihydroxyacetone kinase-like predicted kinase
VVLAMLAQIELEDYEIITIYRGDGITQDESETLAARIEALDADLEVELVDGGQPHYHYILSLE